MDSEIFKAYDVRGIYPNEINEQAAYKIARAYCEFLIKEAESGGERSKLCVAVGCDVRLSSLSLKAAAIKGITDLDIKVIDIGMISTDMLYFAVANYGYNGGFTVTASHNPKEYNGAKFVREESKPISSDTGLFEIRDLALNYQLRTCLPVGKVTNYELNEENSKLVEKKDILDDYIAKIKTFADFSKFKRFKIVANPNFGVAGKNLDKILEGTGIEVIKINYEPDGNFPKGRPDPLIPENRREIAETIVKEKADFGVAWDADADRCFFFTEKGEFIEGYFITAFLAKIFLKKNPGACIIRDTRLTWAIDDIVKAAGGKSIGSKAGHAFIKERMRKENAVFGGEMSAHYYFKDYFYCDNGLVPLVMMLEFLSGQEKTLSAIMREMFWQKYFVSGEINNEVKDTAAVIQKAKVKYGDGEINEIDGVSVEYPDWRFNLRGSNTEPVIRLNVEAKSRDLMQQKRDELLGLIRS